MKAINIDGEIRIFDTLPEVWDHILNFPKAGEPVIRACGFYDVLVPAFDRNLQKIGPIYFSETDQVFTFPVADKTVEELALEKEQLLTEIENNLDIQAIKRLLVILTRDILDSASVTQEQLASIVTIYPQYRENRAYAVNDVFVYENNLYRVIQAHTSQADWMPDAAASLYARYVPAGTIAGWVQPLGSEDAYQVGDKVTHNGKTWESTVDNNVWEPGVYGWTEIV